MNETNSLSSLFNLHFLLGPRSEDTYRGGGRARRMCRCCALQRAKYSVLPTRTPGLSEAVSTRMSVPGATHPECALGRFHGRARVPGGDPCGGERSSDSLPSHQLISFCFRQHPPRNGNRSLANGLVLSAGAARVDTEIPADITNEAEQQKRLDPVLWVFHQVITADSARLTFLACTSTGCYRRDEWCADQKKSHAAMSEQPLYREPRFPSMRLILVNTGQY